MGEIVRSILVESLTFVYLKLQGPFYSLGWICLSYISRRQNRSHLFELILKFGQLFEKR